jgi:gliding motility-associated-like protein
VALSDGTCESLRTEVVAHIGGLAAPVVDPVTICSNNSATIEATIGGNGEVRWYESATAQTPIHTGTTFNTPSLTTSTTYHVTYFETGCESIRVPVTVTVNNCNNQPPLIASVSLTTSVGSILHIDLDLSDPDDNLDLSTLKILTQPASGAIATIDQTGRLSIDYSNSPFIGDDQLVVEVCDLAGSCFQRTITIQVQGSDGDVRIYNAISPNNDGKNDLFFLANITQQLTKKNRVRIYNRWGDLVFDVEDYDNVNNVFSGKSNSGKDLPTGTYYYMLNFSDRAETGYLVLKR